MNKIIPVLANAAAFVNNAIRSPQTPLRAQLNALLGLSVAERAQVIDREEVCGVAARVSLRLAADAADGTFDPYDHDPKLLLLCLHFLREHGLEDEAVLTQFADDVSAVFRELEVVPPRLVAEARLATSLTSEPMADLVTGPPSEPPFTAPLLTASTDEIRATCNWITAESFFGTKAMTAEFLPELTGSLPILLMQKLREYDLVLGAALLRSMVYLGAAEAEELSYAVEYLCVQQRADGGFGYYARELSDSPPLLDPIQELFLPVTVAVLWALTEYAVPGFSIVQRLSPEGFRA